MRTVALSGAGRPARLHSPRSIAVPRALRLGRPAAPRRAPRPAPPVASAAGDASPGPSSDRAAELTSTEVVEIRGARRRAGAPATSPAQARRRLAGEVVIGPLG